MTIGHRVGHGQAEELKDLLPWGYGAGLQKRDKGMTIGLGH